MEAATCCDDIQFCLTRGGSSLAGSSVRFRLLYGLERTSDAETTINWDKVQLCVFKLTRSVPAVGMCGICGVNSSCVACYPGSRWKMSRSPGRSTRVPARSTGPCFSYISGQQHTASVRSSLNPRLCAGYSLSNRAGDSRTISCCRPCS